MSFEHMTSNDNGGTANAPSQPEVPDAHGQAPLLAESAASVGLREARIRPSLASLQRMTRSLRRIATKFLIWVSEHNAG